MLLSLLCTAALAGTLVIQTTVPTDVQRDHQSLVKTFGPALVSLPDLPPGPIDLVVFRGGDGVPITVVVPAQGSLRLLVGTDTLGTDAPPPPPTDGPAPTIELRAASGQRFSLLMDGGRVAIIESDTPLRLAPSIGKHTLEIRSADQTIVWARGNLNLAPGDALVLNLAEGRTIEAFGRPGAWNPVR